MKNFGEVFDKRNLKSQSKYKRTSKRILIKNDLPNLEDLEKGSVVSIVGKNICVETVNKTKILCGVSGVLASQNIDASLLAVGDIVYCNRNCVNKNNPQYEFGTIHKVEKRNKWISRKSVIIPSAEQVISANIHQAILMFSLKNPKYNCRLLDRFLISAEIGFVKPIIVLNKTDLLNKDELESTINSFNIYKKLKIKIFPISVIQNINIEIFKNIIKGRKTVLLGPSGVGKSSLINLITGQQIQKIREISGTSSKGKHTTSNIIMFQIPSISKNTYLIDTPGIREWGVTGIDKQNLSFYFHDFDKYYSKCKYAPCSHTHEPECAVKKGVEIGKIDYDRYISYLNIYDSIL
jgi:ribosome biogenesis GTPase